MNPGWRPWFARGGLPLAWLWCALAGAAPVAGNQEVASLPHDPDAFTQGLVFSAGKLYESTGRYGRSSLRRLDPASGRVEQLLPLAPRLFGEGLTDWGDRLIQLTWREGVGLIRARDDFAPLGEFALPGEGWGITHDGRRWILSDGSASLTVLDPVSRRVLRTVAVQDAGRPVSRLNELEYVRGEVWANIWHSDLIARISPASGAVLGYLDLGGLRPATATDPEAVLNGIAYDAAGDRLFVTGKLWSRLYLIRVTEPAWGGAGE